MEKDIVDYLQKRHATKAFDKTKKIPEETIGKVKQLLRYSASSTNSQPWHFMLASTEEAKAKIAQSTERLYPFNQNSILNASHVVVFCSMLDIDQDAFLKVLIQEEKDGRYAAEPSFKDAMHKGRMMFANMHKQELKDVQHWMDKQVYLNLGGFLLGVATLGIDAAPMEGFERKVLDKSFGLRGKGYSSLVVVPIGYRDPGNDYNAKLPKSRLAYSEIMTLV